MATTELIVAFSAQVAGLETSLKRVNARFDEMSNSAKTAAREINGSVGVIEASFTRLGNNLKSMAFAALAAALTSGMIAAAVKVDDVNTSLTRMRVLTGETKSSVDTLFASLNRLGAQTGQSVDSLTNSFTRFFVATESLGTSRAQVEQLVQTLANFARVSSADPGASAAAITQLAQGLASGRLQGDELKSILENMPPLATALARALNVSVGELRKMGEEGKLTADVVFPALLRAGETLSTRLDGVPISLRQSFQVALDGMARGIREIDQQIGATAWLSRLLLRVGAIGQSLGVAVSGGAPGQEAQEVAEGRILRIAQERNGVERDIARIRADAQAQNRDLTAQERGRLNVLEGQLNLLPRVAADSADVTQAFQNAAARVEGSYEDMIRADEGRRARQATATRNLEALNRTVDDAEKIRYEARQRREQAEQARREGAAESLYRTTIDNINKEEQERLEALRRRNQAETPRVNNAQGQRQTRVENELRAWIRQLEGPLQEFDRRLATTQQNIQGLFTNPNLGVSQGQALQLVVEGVTQDITKLGQELQRLGQDPMDAMEVLRQRMDGIRAALLSLPENVRPTLEQINAALDRVVEGSTARLGRLVERAEKTFNDIAKAGVDAFASDLAGGIVDFAATGEQKFDELAANFLKNIAKMILQLLIFRAIAASLGWAGISIPGVTPPVQGRAAAPPDAYMDPAGGLSAGSVPTWNPYFMGSGATPLMSDIGGGGSSGDVTVNIYNDSQSQVRTQEKTDPMGNKMIEVFIEQVVKNGMSSGRFDGVMQSSFGASRVGRV